MNPFDDVRVAVDNARAQIRAVDSIATAMVRLLVGRLRCCTDGWALAALKRELRDFDMTTKRWKR